MAEIDQRIEALDPALFEGVPSQTLPADRLSLLRVQREIRSRGDYVYLEIGSHLGGSLQPHYADPRCRRIYSIDKRPAAQPDDRGSVYRYEGNSTQVMLDALRRAYPAVDPGKLVTFDRDAAEVNPEAITEKPDLCFIDGQHTNTAVLSDFRFCEQAATADAPILFHDADVTVGALREIRERLRKEQRPFASLKLGGSVYGFFRGAQAARWRETLHDLLQEEERYFRAAEHYLHRQQMEACLAEHPLRLAVYRGFFRCLDAAYKVYARLRSAP